MGANAPISGFTKARNNNINGGSMSGVQIRNYRAYFLIAGRRNWDIESRYLKFSNLFAKRSVKVVPSHSAEVYIGPTITIKAHNRDLAKLTTFAQK
jgi:hypothetical protein